MHARAPHLIPATVDRGSETPLYLQVSRAIESAINSGTLESGTLLEGETSLAARLGLSRPTIRQALQELADKGLVDRRRGSGTFVTGTHKDGPDIPPFTSHSQLAQTRESDGPKTADGASSSRIVGVTVPDLSNPFFSGIVRSIEHQARRLGFLVMFADTEEDSYLELLALDRMSMSVDGLILIAPRSEDQALLGALGTFPHAVSVNRTIGTLPHISADVTPGIRQALGHLRALGHSHISYVGGPVASRAGRKIWENLSQLAPEFACEVNVVSNVQANHAGGYAAGDLVAAAGTTAVITHNDLIALGIVSRLLERGIRVPEDMNVVGFDNQPFAAMGSPTLTSIAVNPQALGRGAVDLLAEEFEGRRWNGTPAVVPSQLVVRGSTGLRRRTDVESALAHTPAR